MVYSEDWSSSNNIAYRKRIAYLADYVNSHSVTLTFDKLHDINVNFDGAALVIVNNWCREYIGKDYEPCGLANIYRPEHKQDILCWNDKNKHCEPEFEQWVGVYRRRE